MTFFFLPDFLGNQLFHRTAPTKINLSRLRDPSFSLTTPSQALFPRRTPNRRRRLRANLPIPRPHLTFSDPRPFPFPNVRSSPVCAFAASPCASLYPCSGSRHPLPPPHQDFPSPAARRACLPHAHKPTLATPASVVGSGVRFPAAAPAPPLPPPPWQSGFPSLSSAFPLRKLQDCYRPARPDAPLSLHKFSPGRPPADRGRTSGGLPSIQGGIPPLPNEYQEGNQQRHYTFPRFLSPLVLLPRSHPYYSSPLVTHSASLLFFPPVFSVCSADPQNLRPLGSFMGRQGHSHSLFPLPANEDPSCPL